MKKYIIVLRDEGTCYYAGDLRIITKVFTYSIGLATAFNSYEHATGCMNILANQLTRGSLVIKEVKVNVIDYV